AVQPLQTGSRISRHAFAREVKEAEAKLSGRLTLLGRSPVPICRFLRVACHTGSLQPERRYIHLCGRDALLGGLFKPSRGFAQFAGTAGAAGIEAPEAKLRFSITSIGCDAIPFCRLDQVWHRRFTGLVELREAQRRRDEILAGRVAQQGLGGEHVAGLFFVVQREQRQIVLRSGVALFSGLVKPLGGLCNVTSNPLTGTVHQPERDLRRSIPPLGRLLVPAGGSFQAFLESVTIGVEDPETELGTGVPLLGSEDVPATGLFVVLFTADPARINEAGVRLRVGDSLLGGRSTPAQCLSGILVHFESVGKQELAIALSGFLVALGGGFVPLRKAGRSLHAKAVEMEQAELMLSLGVIPFCRALIIGCGVGEVRDDAMSARIEQPQLVEGLGISGRGRRRPLP